MTRRRRLYVPLAVDYFRDPALLRAVLRDARCEAFWTRLLCVAKAAETDGVVGEEHMVMTGVTQWRRLLAILVEEGARCGSLITVDGGAWRIVAWSGHNWSAEQIEAERARKAANVAAYRERKEAERTGDVTGDVTGNNIGYVTGDVTGDVTGHSLSKKLEARSKKTSLRDVPRDSSSASTSSKRERTRSAAFDAVTEALANHGLSVPGGTVTELGKVATKTRRTAEYVVALAVRLARVDHIDLAECTATERTRLLSAVAQVAALTDDIDEVVRRATNARDAGERSIADALKHRWSRHDTPTHPTTPARTAPARHNEAFDRVVTEIQAVEAAGGIYRFPSLLEIGSRP